MVFSSLGRQPDFWSLAESRAKLAKLQNGFTELPAQVTAPQVLTLAVKISLASRSTRNYLMHYFPCSMTSFKSVKFFSTLTARAPLRHKDRRVKQIISSPFRELSAMTLPRSSIDPQPPYRAHNLSVLGALREPVEDLRMDPVQGDPPFQVEKLQAEAPSTPSPQPANGSTANAAATKPEHDTHENLSTPSDVEAAPEKEEVRDEEPQRSSLKTGLIMASLCIAVFLAALDTTIVTTAIPTIAEVFTLSEADYTWVGSSFLLAAAASVPTWGKFSDIWGRKPILLLANTVFFFGSLIAALSINIRMLLAGRVVQGIGGGGLIILANICISDLFSQRERGKYFGMIGGVWGLASALGPVLGGVFTEKVSWRWCFYINLPFDGLAFVIILFLLDIDVPKTPVVAGLKAIDWIGVITISGGTVMFLLGLEYGGVTYPWNSAPTICLILFGLVTIGLFFVNEWKFAKYPVMPLRLFKYRSNVACLVVCFIHGMVFISGAYFLPLYFQAVLGATPILSGVYLFPYVLSLSFTSIVGGIFIKKTGKYLPPIWLGLIFMAIGFGLYIDIPATRTWGRIFPFQIIAGLGVGPNFQAPLIALQTKVAPRDIATATALFGFTRNLATAISVVIGGVIFQNRMIAHQAMLRASLPPATAKALGSGNAGASTGLVNSLPPDQQTVVRQAYTESLRDIWIFFVAIAAVGVLASLAIGNQKLSKEHETYKGGLEQEEKNRQEDLVAGAQKKLDKEERRRSRRSQDLGAGGAGKDAGANHADSRRKSRQSQDRNRAAGIVEEKE